MSSDTNAVAVKLAEIANARKQKEERRKQLELEAEQERREEEELMKKLEAMKAEEKRKAEEERKEAVFHGQPLFFHVREPYGLTYAPGTGRSVGAPKVTIAWPPPVRFSNHVDVDGLNTAASNLPSPS